MKTNIHVPSKVTEFWQGQQIYFSHVLALLTPGVETPQHESHRSQPKPLDDWSEPDHLLMIEEGRRQADRQLSDLSEVRGRAQWLFTVGVAATIAVGGAFGADGPAGARTALFITSLFTLGYGVAGAVAIMAGRADFGLIDATVLSHQQPPIERYLAGAYSRMLRVGENTVATRITIFRQAVLWIILGGYMGLIAALI
jgi:hypothetical protein